MKNIKKFIFKVFYAPKTWHPILFPFIYLIANILHQARKNINLIFCIFNRDKTNYNLLKELDSKGYVVIRGYLDNKEHEKLKDFFTKEMSDNSSSNFGNSIRFGIKVKSLLNNKAFNFKIFTNKLKRLSSHISPWIGCYFEKFKGDNDGQQNEIFHIDTFHPTFKLFYYPYAVKSYPFEFISGSQKFGWKNFIFNYACQIKNFISEVKSNPLNCFLIAGFRNGSWRYNEASIGISKRNIEQNKVTFKVPENTLIIANTAGFHRRSTSFSGEDPERYMINFIERSSIFI